MDEVGRLYCEGVPVEQLRANLSALDALAKLIGKQDGSWKPMGK